jgi:hypothetical protein
MTDKKNYLLAVKMTLGQRRSLERNARAVQMSVPDFVRYIAEMPQMNKQPDENRAVESLILARVDQALAKHLDGMKQLLDG